MRHRPRPSMGRLVTVIAVLCVALVAITAQAQRSGGKVKTKPPIPSRTPWGEPDLQGVWDFRSVIPLERPKDVAGKEVLTDEESVAFVARETVRRDRDHNVPAGDVGDYNQFWYDYFAPDPTRPKRTSLLLDRPDGRIPPFTPEAQKREDARTEAERRRDGPEDRPLRERCLMGFNSGPPMTPNAYNNNIQIIQTPGYVALLNEMVHDTRIIPMDGRPHGNVRQWAGDSRGHWNGDTLVIDTTQFRDTTATQAFRGSSKNLHLVERFTRIDADTLLYEFTIDDPTTWTNSWTAAMPMRRSQNQIYEYACHEGNYAMTGILAGARAEEKAAEEVAKKRR